MIVKLISDYGQREKIISRNAELADVIELIDIEIVLKLKD